MAEAKFTSFVENSGSSIERMFRRAAARTAAGVPTGTPDHNHRLFDFEEAHASIRLPAIDWSGAPIAKAIFARVRTGTTTLVPSRQPSDAASALDRVIDRIAKQQRLAVRRQDFATLPALSQRLDEAIAARARLITK